MRSFGVGWGWSGGLLLLGGCISEPEVVDLGSQLAAIADKQDQILSDIAQIDAAVGALGVQVESLDCAGPGDLDAALATVGARQVVYEYDPNAAAVLQGSFAELLAAVETPSDLRVAVASDATGWVSALTCAAVTHDAATGEIVCEGAPYPDISTCEDSAGLCIQWDQGTTVYAVATSSGLYSYGFAHWDGADPATVIAPESYLYRMVWTRDP